MGLITTSSHTSLHFNLIHSPLPLSPPMSSTLQLGPLSSPSIPFPISHLPKISSCPLMILFLVCDTEGRGKGRDFECRFHRRESGDTRCQIWELELKLWAATWRLGIELESSGQPVLTNPSAISPAPLFASLVRGILTGRRWNLKMAISALPNS